jgi:hypothetical protein
MNRSVMLADGKHRNIANTTQGHGAKKYAYKNQNKQALVSRLGQKIKEWFHNSVSRAYIPTLTIDTMDDGEEGLQ